MEKALQVKLNYKLKNYVEKNVLEKWIGYFYFSVYRKEKPQTENLEDLHYKSITRNKSKKENNIKILLISSINLSKILKII